MSILQLFELLVFIAQKGIFSFQNIVKDNFLAYTALKKKFKKRPFLDQKHGLTPLQKCQFYRLFEFVVFIAQKGFFSLLEYRKRHFPGLYCLKKKVGKMAIFGPKAWVNPFGKKSIFLLFQFLVFTAQKGVFLFYDMVKDIFLASIS